MSDATADGWTLSTRFRLVDDDSHNSQAPLFHDGSTRWAMWFNFDASGNLLLGAQTNAGVGGAAGGFGVTVASGAAAADYHDYVMTYDPTTMLASISVDGSEVISNYGGASFASFIHSGVSWGGSSTPGSGIGHWNSMSLQANSVPAPAPGTLALLGLGLIATAVRRQRLSFA